MMEQGLVCYSSHVLISLLSSDLHVNQIIKRTGLYKDHVRADINTLQKGQLIMEMQDPNHRQKKTKTLTELGRELATLKDGIDRFHISYDSLQGTGRSIFDITRKDPKVVQRLLKDEKWTKKEIDNYEDWKEEARSVLGHALRLFTDALLVRYTLITSRFNLNKHAKPFLIKIVIDALSEHLSARPIIRNRCIHCGALNPDITHLFNDLDPWIFGLIDNIDLTNKFANNEIKNLLKSSFLLMAPPKQYLQERLKEETDIIQEISNSPYIYKNKARAAFYDELLK